MFIRIARLGDIQKIRELTINATVGRESQESVGFVEYNTPIAEEFQQRIKSRLFLVAEEEGTVAGFDAAYSGEFIRRNGIEDPIMRYLSKKNTDLFVYNELLVVAETQRRKGIGKILMDHVERGAITQGYPKIFCAVAHEPKRHAVSEHILLSSGYRDVDRVSFDELVFGIYEKCI